VSHRAADFTVILKVNERPIGTSFLVHRSGLLATCFHVVKDAFGSTDDVVGKIFNYYPLPTENTVNPKTITSELKARVTSHLDPVNDIALLQIEGDVPEWLKPVALIRSDTAIGYAFSLDGYADIPDPNAVYHAYHAEGKIEAFIPRNETQVIKLKSQDLFKGMSGGAIYCASLNGVVGMQSARLAIDPRSGGFGKDTGFASRSDAIVNLMPTLLTLLTSQAQSLSGSSERLINAHSVQIFNISDFSRDEWMRPAEFDTQRRWNQAVQRHTVLDVIHEHIGPKQKGTNTLALWGMPGIGKTTLAALYVNQYGNETEYPGGVLWVDIGSQFNPEQDIERVRDRWGNYAFSGLKHQLRGQSLARINLSALDVAARLGEHGEMLIVFDDVTDLSHIQAFNDLIPPTANVLITTNDRTVARGGSMRFFDYEVTAMFEDEALELLRSWLPDLNESSLRQIAAQFEHHPYAMTLIAAELREQFNPADALRQMLSNSQASQQALQPLWTAYEYTFNALKDETVRKQFGLLTLVNPAGADFSTETASILWGTSSAEAEATLKLLRDRTLISYNHRHRWSLKMPISQMVSKYIIDEHNIRDALNRYEHAMLNSSTLPGRWESDEPDLPHFRHVIEHIIMRYEGRLNDVFSASDISQLDPVSEAESAIFTLLTASLSSALMYLLTHSETFSFGQRWIHAYIALCVLLNQPEAAGWGWIVLGRWLAINEITSEAVETLKHAYQYAEDIRSVQVAAYALMEQGNIFQREGKIAEGLDAFKRAYTLIIETEFDDPQLELNLMTGLSNLYMTNFSYESARLYLEQAQERLGKLPPNPTSEMQMLRLLGILYVSQTQIDQGIETFELAEAIATDLADERSLAEIKVHLANAYTQKGLHDRATSVLDTAEEMAKNIPYPRLNTSIRLNRAGLMATQGDFIATTTLLLEAQDQLARYPDKNLEAQCLAALGEVNFRMGQMDEAMGYLNQALPLFRDLQNTSTAVTVLNTIGLIYEQTNRIEEGLDFFQDKLPLIQDLNMIGAEVTIFQWLSILLNRVGDGRQAIKYFDKAQAIVDDIENTAERVMLLSLTAMVYRYFGEVEKAQATLLKVEADCRKTNNRVKLREVLLQLAETQIVRQDYPSAQLHLDEVQTLLDDSEESQLMQANHANIQGMVYLGAQEFDEAEKMFERCYSLNETLRNPTLQINNLNNLALISLYRQNIETAESYLETALELAKAIGFAPQLALVLTNLGFVHWMRGSFDKAENMFEEGANVLEESGIQADSANQSVEMLRAFAQMAHANEQGDAQTDTLKLLLEMVSWETLSSVIRVRHELLLTSYSEEVLMQSARIAETNKQTLLARALAIYRRLLTDCRSKGLNILQQHGDYITPDLERWWAYQHRLNLNYSAALHTLNRVVERKLNDIDALIDRGWVYRGLGQLVNAKEDFDLVLKYVPNNQQAHLGLGVVLYESGQFDSAILHLTRAIERNPQDAYAYQWRSAVYQALTDYESAIQDLNKAVELDKHNSEHRYWRGINWLAMKRFGDAREEFTTLIDAERENKEALSYDYFWRGVANDLFGDQRAAKVDWGRGVRLAENEKTGWCLPLYQLIFRQDSDSTLSTCQTLLSRPYKFQVVNQFMQHLKFLVCLYPEKEVFHTLIETITKMID
jgi:tetratricopeptide (TPR) repeat protein